MYHRQYRQFCTKRASFYFFFSLNRIIHNISTTSIPLFQTSIANSFHRHHFSLHKRNFLPTKRPSIVLCKFISCKFPNIYISQRRSRITSSPCNQNLDTFTISTSEFLTLSLCRNKEKSLGTFLLEQVIRETGCAIRGPNIFTVVASYEKEEKKRQRERKGGEISRT